MTDDDKTPVDLVITPTTFERVGTLTCPLAEQPATCGAPIRDRSGRDLGYACNLTRGHLGKHASIWQGDGPNGRSSAVVDGEMDQEDSGEPCK